MSSTPLAIGRIALLGALITVSALAAPSAGAASGAVEFSCQLGILDTEGLPLFQGEGTATASFDTAIPDGLVVSVPDSVDMTPFTGAMTFTDEFTDQLRGAGITTLDVEGQTGEMNLALFLGEEEINAGEELEDGYVARFSFSGGTVPADGPLSLAFEGIVTDSISLVDPRGFPLEDAGTGTVWGSSFFTDYSTQNGFFSLSCSPDERFRFLIDTVEATVAATPTPTATMSPMPGASPVRPVLVQTDFAEDDAGAAPLLGVGAFMTLTAGMVGVVLGRKRATSRRH